MRTTHPSSPPPKYLGEDEFEPNSYDFILTLDKYYPQQMSSPESCDLDCYQKRLKQLLADKNIDPGFVDQFEPLYYTGYLPSNSYENAFRFLEVVFNDEHVTGGYEDIVRVRHGILSMYSTHDYQRILDQIHKLNPKEVRGYKTYLEGSYYFYSRDYDKALKVFQELRDAESQQSFSQKVLSLFTKHPPSWLEETAAYMEARVLLIMSQEKMHGYEYGDRLREKLDLDKLHHSAELFEQYLKDYPDGRYVQSVKGLRRKFNYMLGQQGKLNEALSKILNEALESSRDSQRVWEAFNEFSMYYEGGVDFNSDSPLIIAYFIQSKPGQEGWLEKLERQQKRFESYPELFLYLKALLLYRGKKYHELINSIPDVQPQDPDDILLFTTEVLRAKALVALERYEDALKVLSKLKSMQDDHVDLQILKAHVALKSSKEKIVAALQSGLVLESFLEGGCSEADLEALATSDTLSPVASKLVKKELLRRYFVTGHLEKAASHELFQNQEFNDIRPYILTLINNPNDTKSLLEIGKWLMKGPIHPSEAPEELMQECPDCIQMVNFEPPLYYFLKILDQKPPKSMVEAETLHYLIDTCFRGASPAQSCQWMPWWETKLVDENYRKRVETLHKTAVPHWFRTLHSKYKGSSWAKSTPYYY